MKSIEGDYWGTLQDRDGMIRGRNVHRACNVAKGKLRMRRSEYETSGDTRRDGNDEVQVYDDLRKPGGPIRPLLCYLPTPNAYVPICTFRCISLATQAENTALMPY